MILITNTNTSHVKLENININKQVLWIISNLIWLSIFCRAVPTTQYPLLEEINTIKP